MRKIGFYLLILLAMVMVISCGNDKKSDKEENAASEKVETEEGEEEADADPVEKPLCFDPFGQTGLLTLAII